MCCYSNSLAREQQIDKALLKILMSAPTQMLSIESYVVFLCTLTEYGLRYDSMQCVHCILGLN